MLILFEQIILNNFLYMINIKYFEQYLKIIDETNIVSKTDEK
jgi:hypothetical protein